MEAEETESRKQKYVAWHFYFVFEVEKQKEIWRRSQGTHLET